MGLYQDNAVLFNSDSANYSALGVLQSSVNQLVGATTYYGPAVSFANFTGGVVLGLPATVAGTSPTLTTAVQVQEQGVWATVAAVTGSLTDANFAATALTTSTLFVKTFGGNAPAYVGNLLRVTVTLGGTTPTVTGINSLGAANRVAALVITADAQKRFPDNA